MKVVITEQSKYYLTVNEYEKAKELVKQLKGDGFTAAEVAEYGARAILDSAKYRDESDGVAKVLDASAEICRDSSTPWDYHGDGCGFLNVWINATVETWNGFIKFGCLYSDAVSVDGSDESKNAVANHSYVRYFKEKKS